MVELLLLREKLEERDITVENIFRYYFEVSEWELFSKEVRDHSESVLWIFDGYDEVESNQSSKLQQFLKYVLFLFPFNFVFFCFAGC